MDRAIRILVLEDAPGDAELMIRALRRSGLDVAWKRVETQDDFVAGLAEYRPDLVLSDYNLPAYDGRRAIQATRRACPEVPVVIVTGTLGDELAVELLKAGASDYVLKENLVRLGPAVRRALAEAESERSRRRAEDALKEAERDLRKANRALRTRSAGNEAVVRAVDERTLLRAACRAVVEVGRYPKAWVGYVQPDAPRAIRPVAHCGFGGDPVVQLDLPLTHGSQETVAEAALRTGEAQIARPPAGPGNGPASGTMDDSCLAIPFKVNGTRGVLCIHAAEPDAFDPEEVRLLQDLVADVSYGITSLRIAAEHESAEQALQASEMRFRRIVETAQEGIWMLDREGRTTYMNRRMAEMLGVDATVVAGTAAAEFVDADAASGFLRSMAGAADEGSSSGRSEYVLRRRDGSCFRGAIATNAMHDEAGRHLGFLAMVTDVTQQRELQEQIMVSDRMASVGMLAAGVVHEINNPLAAMLANIQLALDGLGRDGGAPASVPDLREGLGDALEAARRVRNIVGDLRIFSRAQENRTGPVDVQDALESALRMAWNEIKHRARVVRDYQPVPCLEWNESRIGQVFLNLLVNAAQAIDEGHAERNQIAVATRTDGRGRVVVEIRDTGRGMPPEVLRLLFTPFFTTKPAGTGTGLGLSICQRIVAEGGGEIEVESAPGKGSTFRVVLPAAPPGVRPEARPAEAEPVPAPRRGSILVVDDEDIVRNAVRRVLEGEHDVTLAASGQGALDRLASGESFDVILCDLVMPEMSGMDVYAELCKSRPEMAPSVVFMSGGAFTPRARTFLVEAGRECVEKPFDVAHLRNLVNGRLRDDPDRGGTS